MNGLLQTGTDFDGAVKSFFMMNANRLLISERIINGFYDYTNDSDKTQAVNIFLICYSCKMKAADAIMFASGKITRVTMPEKCG